MDSIQYTLSIIFCLVGLAGFIAPKKLAKQVGLVIEDHKGKIEFQSIYGGLIFGLGLAGVLIDSNEAYQVLGIGLISIAGARFLGLLLIKAQLTLNTTVFLMLVELLGGILLIMG